MEDDVITFQEILGFEKVALPEFCRRGYSIASRSEADMSVVNFESCAFRSGYCSEADVGDEIAGGLLLTQSGT